MVTIINGFRQPNPIAEGIRNAAQAIFGDRLTPALKRSQLNLSEQRFAQSDAELRSRIDFANRFDERQSAGILGGLSSPDISGAIRSGAAAEALAGGGDLLGNRGLNAAQLGAGQAASSTGLGFREGEAQDALLTREGIASTSATSRANQADRIAAENTRFGSDLIEAIDASGNAVMIPRGEASGLGAVITEAERKGLLLGQNFEDLGGLSPRQATVLGALPSETDVRGDLLSQAIGATGIDLSAVPQANVLEAAGLGAPPPIKTPTLLRFQSRDSTQFFTSADGGITDNVTGQPIPQDAIRVGAVSPTTIADAGGLTTTNETNLVERAIQLNNYRSMSDLTKNVAQANLEAFGFEGTVRRGLKSAERVAGAVNSLFGGQEGLNRQIQAARAAISADPRIPADEKATLLGRISGNLDAPKQMHALLAYQAAAAVAEQTGRGLSDKDFINFSTKILKDPNSLFTDQQRFLDSVELLDITVNTMIEANQAVRAGGDPSGNEPLFDLNGNQLE